jgi:hypothetical protein
MSLLDIFRKSEIWICVTFRDIAGSTEEAIADLKKKADRWYQANHDIYGATGRYQEQITDLGQAFHNRDVQATYWFLCTPSKEQRRRITDDFQEKHRCTKPPTLGA